MLGMAMADKVNADNALFLFSILVAATAASRGLTTARRPFFTKIYMIIQGAF